MGFPSCYSELMLAPSLLLRLISLLGFLRRLILSAFDAVGLSDLLDDSSSDDSHRPEFRPLSIQEQLPAVRYGDTVAGECAVCLSEFGRDEEVRRMSNCCHVFHRSCIDGWIVVGHEQRTCPLCRAPIFSGETAAAAGGGDVGDSEYYYYYSHILPSSSPISDSALFLPFFSSHY